LQHLHQQARGGCKSQTVSHLIKKEKIIAIASLTYTLFQKLMQGHLRRKLQ
jgi:hypothetical protein